MLEDVSDSVLQGGTLRGPVKTGAGIPSGHLSTGLNATLTKEPRFPQTPLAPNSSLAAGLLFRASIMGNLGI